MMIKTYFLNSKKLPLVIEANQKDRGLQMLNELMQSRREYFRAELLGCGALLFRGFEIQTIKEFSEFVREFSGKEFFNYAGGASPRQSLEKSIYTSTEYPPELALELHNELSYSKIYPQHLYFYCQTAPENGGETTLADSRRILQKIRPKIVGLFKHKNVLYERNLDGEKGSGFSWHEAFETSDRQEIEEICRKTGIAFDWQQNDRLNLRQRCPATCIHPQTGEEVWFNQAHGFYTNIANNELEKENPAGREKLRLNSYFGDGSWICSLLIEHIRKVLLAETIKHRWQPGDILILDNLLTAHGRMPFKGARKIILAMT